MAAKLIISCILSLFLTFFFKPSNAAYNVIDFGAKSDGEIDSTQAFLKAWAAACSSVKASTIYVPTGRYLIKNIVFRGPCKNKIAIQIKGTIVAPTDYHVIGKTGNWILFVQVDRVSVIGGTLDAQGAGFWACRKSGQNCPVGSRSITFDWASNVMISGLTSINSQLIHLAINSCKNVIVRNVKLIAPDESPNTDGIHIQSSTGVKITGSIMQTGDDCISIGPGTRNLYMSSIKCGPGHGVSIGSLGWGVNEDGVENVTLTNSRFTGSDNGASGVKISQVTYRNIQGTSATAEAVTFDCSPGNPCRGIILQDIKLTYMNKAAATSSCKNIGGMSSGVLMPESCLYEG
ncbi:Pectin lyase-like superfamily protein [Citrus sinensis]|nr:Pectin lyase-like superfamily protein [Citrus sinensis]